MKCSWCKAAAHFDFGEGQKLCADCTNILLAKAKIQPPVPTGVGLASQFQPLQPASPSIHPLDIPDYLRRTQA